MNIVDHMQLTTKPSLMFYTQTIYVVAWHLKQIDGVLTESSKAHEVGECNFAKLQ